MRHPKGATLKRIQPWRLDGEQIAVGIFQNTNGTHFSAFVQMSADGKNATRLATPPHVLFHEPMVWHSIAQTMSDLDAPLVSQPPANSYGEPPVNN